MGSKGEERSLHPWVIGKAGHGSKNASFDSKMKNQQVGSKTAISAQLLLLSMGAWSGLLEGKGREGDVDPSGCKNNFLAPKSSSTRFLSPEEVKITYFVKTKSTNQIQS